MEKETLYSRWLTGSLSDEEIQTLKRSGEWEVLEKIISETDRWSLPELRNDSYLRLRAGLANRQQESARVVPISRKPFIYGIAASLIAVVVVTFWFLKPQNVTYQCAAGKMLKVILPDSTRAQLTGYSSLTFDENDFSEGQRKVALSGQGYFDVRQEGAFSVEFNSGVVNVLGTCFDILAGDRITTVRCFDGTVEVSHNETGSHVLKKGMGVRIDGGDKSIERLTVPSENPDWLSGESVFSDSPLKEVMNAMVVQYHVTFDAAAIDVDRRYSGKFTHANLESALQMVFRPMGISWQLSGDTPVHITLRPNPGS